jgi:hypothetical protein
METNLHFVYKSWRSPHRPSVGSRCERRSKGIFRNNFSKLNKVTKFACFTHEKFIHVRSLFRRTSLLELVIQSIILESSNIIIWQYNVQASSLSPKLLGARYCALFWDRLQVGLSTSSSNLNFWNLT